MTDKIFYLDNILNSEMNREERIVAILKARGFLIDETNGRFYMSDNASVDDVKYLKSGLKNYWLGHIKDDEGYKTSSRRCWKYDRSYSYNNIRPQKIELIFSDDASEENASAFFASNGQIGNEAGSSRRTWHEFAWEKNTWKADVVYLEAYIAFYVKAVSACGVNTSYSCDGNHENGGKVYIYSDYPSSIWHEYLWKYIVCRFFGDIPFIEKGIPFHSEEEQREVYQLVNRIAAFLYLNRGKIRMLKYKTLEKLTTKFIHRHSEEEIESFYRAECERILSDEKAIAGLTIR